MPASRDSHLAIAYAVLAQYVIVDIALLKTCSRAYFIAHTFLILVLCASTANKSDLPLGRTDPSKFELTRFDCIYFCRFCMKNLSHPSDDETCPKGAEMKGEHGD